MNDMNIIRGVDIEKSSMQSSTDVAKRTQFKKASQEEELAAPIILVIWFFLPVLTITLYELEASFGVTVFDLRVAATMVGISKCPKQYNKVAVSLGFLVFLIVSILPWSLTRAPKTGSFLFVSAVLPLISIKVESFGFTSRYKTMIFFLASVIAGLAFSALQMTEYGEFNIEIFHANFIKATLNISIW